MDSNSKDWVKKYIETRVERGKQWRSQLEEHKKLALAEVPRYIRILGEKFRPVSISDVNPCGQLLGKHNGVEIGGFYNLKDAIKQSHSVKVKRPNAPKPEHQIQAFLIRSALQNQSEFGRFEHELPDFEGIFEELIFITDEFAVKPGKGEAECRADIIALGGKDGRYFPVFIELKNSRLLGKLKEQLDNAYKWLWTHEQARGPFAEFLSAVSGVALDKIDKNENAARKMLIWPKSRSGNEDKSVNLARLDRFLIVEFEPVYKFSGKSV